MTQTRGTLFGLAAIGLWSAAPSLIRLCSEAVGAVTGAALIYTLASVMLVALRGWTPLRQYPRRYLLIGGALFAGYEVALALALGLARDRTQAIEVALLNYLWPCLTVLLMVLSGRQRATPWLAPGLLLSLLGVAWILNGGDGWSLAHMAANAARNPWSYGLAAGGALLWSVYCCAAKPLAQGTDAIVPFFVLTSIALWVKYALGGAALTATVASVPSAWAAAGLLGAAAAVMALGYASWNRALAHGNLALLAAISYASPVLSAACSAAMLRATLSAAFWQGAAMVTAGSLCCWWATRK
ncbi:drug/metabolite transporter (DMT)-like permease [Duganella sp. 1224]|uniref:aromatic amino acid DMT transporter YddG n=1 Tax=Duganella sp. 1224 TaxID=2587052 RepID=UPI0015CA60A7|nr:aromatic amino acid DMT transporter YddG [Duganella sp. 1224]NYE60245.1 drug/metabolite transporter (DMT)-like permease [Duganella sp. 1224]